jgi:hypothetical protein
MLPRLLLAILVVMTIACGDHHSATNPPLIPSAPSAVLESTPAGEQWNLTTTLRDFAGPDACSIYTDYVGEPEDWLMTVARSGGSIHLDISLLDDPSVHIEYDGTVVSGVLSAAARQSLQGRVCRGSRVSLGAELRLSGLFSEDGHALAAQEVTSSQLSSGETLVFHSDWNATQKR